MTTEVEHNRRSHIASRMADLMEDVIEMNLALGNSPEDLIAAIAAGWGLEVTITRKPQ